MAQFTTAEVAAKFDTTPRELRKFLRADAAATGAPTPGKGSRYAVEGKALAPLKKRFKAWGAAQAEAKASKAEAPAVEVIEEELDTELDGPTDEEIAALEA